MNTPIMQTLLPLVRAYGSLKAKKWLEGEEELAIADDDLASFLARQDVEWDHLLTVDQDYLRDAYIEAGKTEMARRLTGSDPVNSSLLVSVAPAASCASPAPLVPEVVKVVVEALELAESFIGEYSGKKSDRAFAKIVAALTALRSYSPAPSPSVELLREARDQLQEVMTLPNPYTFNEQAIMKRVQGMVSKLNAALA